MSGPMPIALEAVLKELKAAERHVDSGPEGWTSAEFADILKVHRKVAQERIREWVRDGSLVFVGLRLVPNVCGGHSRVPVYARP